MLERSLRKVEDIFIHKGEDREVLVCLKLLL